MAVPEGPYGRTRNQWFDMIGGAQRDALMAQLKKRYGQRLGTSTGPGGTRARVGLPESLPVGDLGQMKLEGGRFKPTGDQLAAMNKAYDDQMARGEETMKGVVEEQQRGASKRMAALGGSMDAQRQAWLAGGQQFQRAPRTTDMYGGVLKDRASKRRSLMDTDINRMDLAGPFAQFFDRYAQPRRSFTPGRRSMDLGMLAPFASRFQYSPRA